jgi:hypothetical protein
MRLNDVTLFVGRSVRLGRPRRILLYVIAGGVWATGSVWLALHYLWTGQGTFGRESSPLEPWVLAAHGAFAFACLWVLGVLWDAHILGAWKGRRRRRSGIALLGWAAALVATGYLLYYAGGDALRAVISPLHWVLGLAAPILFAAHRLAASVSSARRVLSRRAGEEANTEPAPRSVGAGKR